MEPWEIHQSGIEEIIDLGDRVVVLLTWDLGAPDPPLFGPPG